MKRLKCTRFIMTTIIVGLFLLPLTGLAVYAQEEAQVIYDFIQTTEETLTYGSPDMEDQTDIIIPKGEQILVVSQTGDGWYQILYHEEILYISSQGGNVEDAVISDEVLEEIEKEREDCDLTQEEWDMLIGTSEKKQQKEILPKILLGVVAVVVLLSGIGYFYISRKEEMEQAKRRKQAEVDHNDR